MVLLDAARKEQVALGSPKPLRDESPDEWVRSFLSAGREGAAA